MSKYYIEFNALILVDAESADEAKVKYQDIVNDYNFRTKLNAELVDSTLEGMEKADEN